MEKPSKLYEPNIANVKEILKKFHTVIDNPFNSGVKDKAIKKLIKRFPDNKNIESVYLKVSVINSLYSTNIIDTYKIAHNIQKPELGFDKAIKDTDRSIVDKIAMGHGILRKNKLPEQIDINFYSFATKYCSWHDLNGNSFPIYDAYIEFALKEHNKERNFLKGKGVPNLREYKNLVETLTSFKNFHKLYDYSFKKLDSFLWYSVKEAKEKKTD